MADMSVAELKRRFSDVLDRVAGGERFVVTRRGRPVALLTAVPEELEEPPLGVLSLMGALDREPGVAEWALSVAEIVSGRERLTDRDPPDLD